MCRLRTSLSEKDVSDVTLRREGAVERMRYHVWQQANCLRGPMLLTPGPCRHQSNTWLSDLQRRHILNPQTQGLGSRV